MKRILIVSGLFCILNNLFAATPVTYDFAVVDGDTLRMDVYMPDGEVKAPRPAVLFAFGSGFINGSRSNPDFSIFWPITALWPCPQTIGRPFPSQTLRALDLWLGLPRPSEERLQTL